MLDLSQQRCFNHASREAAARCPECGRYYCRECVTEHEDRVLCARCIKRVSRRETARRFHLGGLGRFAQVAFGVVVLWALFYLLGQGLLAIPSSFHEQAVWDRGWWEER